MASTGDFSLQDIQTPQYPRNLRGAGGFSQPFPDPVPLEDFQAADTAADRSFEENYIPEQYRPANAGSALQPSPELPPMADDVGTELLLPTRPFPLPSTSLASVQALVPGHSVRSSVWPAVAPRSSLPKYRDPRLSRRVKSWTGNGDSHLKSATKPCPEFAEASKAPSRTFRTPYRLLPSPRLMIRRLEEERDRDTRELQRAAPYAEFLQEYDRTVEAFTKKLLDERQRRQDDLQTTRFSGRRSTIGGMTDWRTSREPDEQFPGQREGQIPNLSREWESSQAERLRRDPRGDFRPTNVGASSYDTRLEALGAQGVYKAPVLPEEDSVEDVTVDIVHIPGRSRIIKREKASGENARQTSQSGNQQQSDPSNSAHREKSNPASPSILVTPIPDPSHKISTPQGNDLKYVQSPNVAIKSPSTQHPQVGTKEYVNLSKGPGPDRPSQADQETFALRRKIATRAEVDIVSFYRSAQEVDSMTANAYCRAGAPAYIFLEAGVKQGFVRLAGREDCGDFCLLVSRARNSGHMMSFPLEDYVAEFMDLSDPDAIRALWIRDEFFKLFDKSGVNVAIRVTSRGKHFSFSVPAPQMKFWVHLLRVPNKDMYEYHDPAFGGLP